MFSALECISPSKMAILYPRTTLAQTFMPLASNVHTTGSDVDDASELQNLFTSIISHYSCEMRLC